MIRHTLCWDCANAVHDEKCPWVKDATPVPGWEAEETHHTGFFAFDSYRVTKCPLFVRDAYCGGAKRVKGGVRLADD